MNHAAAKSYFGALDFTIDVKNGRFGAGTLVLGDPVAAAARLAIPA